MACAMKRQASHDCCKHRTNLRSNDCCCAGAHQASPPAFSSLPQHAHALAFFVAALSQTALGVPALDCGVGLTAPLGCGPAPPDTPITQHTQLLL
jgi:hypothetical protein